jgi:hypothetical protein
MSASHCAVQLPCRHALTHPKADSRRVRQAGARQQAGISLWCLLFMNWLLTKQLHCDPQVVGSERIFFGATVHEGSKCLIPLHFFSPCSLTERTEMR